jgi:hypothetical protein
MDRYKDIVLPMLLRSNRYERTKEGEKKAKTKGKDADEDRRRVRRGNRESLRIVVTEYRLGKVTDQELETKVEG